jgi:hypothetical protein
MFDYKMPTLPPVAEPVWFYPPAVKKTKKVSITKSDTAVKFVVSQLWSESTPTLMSFITQLSPKSLYPLKGKFHHLILSLPRLRMGL